MPRTSVAESRAVRISDFYKPFVRQEQFHVNLAKYRLFGGAAGPGKSKALLMEAIAQANQVPKSDTLLLRRTFPELEQSILLYFRRDVPHEMYKAYNESKRTVTWWNDSITRFGYCQSENDVYQYQGGEYLFIGLDELTLFTLRQWQFLTSRNRCPVRASFPCMAGATNPGNIGHAWVKSLWIDKKPAPGMESPSEYDPADYDFISAKVTDNPIYANDAQYLKTLNSLPSHLRRAFLEGDWSVFAGQYFGNFDTATMTATIRAKDIPDWCPRWISVDWGFEHTAAAHWHCKRDDGQTQTYRELGRRHCGPMELAYEIADLCEGEDIQQVYLSPDAWAKRTDELTVAEQIGDVFVMRKLPRPTPADNDRVGGWILMWQMLQSGSWIISDACPQLISTLPTLVRDEDNIEDCVKMDGDDYADCARYGIKSRHRKGIQPASVRVANRLAQIQQQRAAQGLPPVEDPTAIAMMSAKAAAAESKKSQLVPLITRSRYQHSRYRN